MAGNPADFFIRDLTNGSLLPFEIEAGTPPDSIRFSYYGGLGLGSSRP